MTLDGQNYVEKAEQVILKYSNNTDARGRNYQKITTTQIRNLLSLIIDIYNDVMNQKEEKLSDDIKGRIAYLQVRFAYESGRNKDVKNFVETAGLLAALKEIKGNRSGYILFTRYMEALVAYHRFYGGRD